MAVSSRSTARQGAERRLSCVCRCLVIHKSCKGEHDMKSADERIHPREELMLKVEYPGVDDLVYDYTRNISHGGTFILTERTFKIGARVEVELSFPGLLQPIRLQGVVRWTSSGAGGGDERGVGVEFEGAPAEAERLKS